MALAMLAWLANNYLEKHPWLAEPPPPPRWPRFLLVHPALDCTCKLVSTAGMCTIATMTTPDPLATLVGLTHLSCRPSTRR